MNASTYISAPPQKLHGLPAQGQICLTLVRYYILFYFIPYTKVISLPMWIFRWKFRA